MLNPFYMIGKMTLKQAAILIVNYCFMKKIKFLSKNKERDFDRWFWRFTHRWSRLPGMTYFGSAIDCDLNDFIPKRIFFFGIWEPEISQAITNELRPGDVFVDVGANIGYDTLLGSRLVGSGGHVVAIEASNRNFLELTRNLQRNKVSNVRAVQIAVSDREGELTLFSEEGNQGRTSSINRPGSQKSETVKALPLDVILTPEERQRTRLIKVDIEGGEIPMLERLVQTIDLYAEDVRLIVEMSSENSDRSQFIFDSMMSAGFSAYALSNDYAISAYLRRARPAPATPITLPPVLQTDVLFKRGPNGRAIKKNANRILQ